MATNSPSSPACSRDVESGSGMCPLSLGAHGRTLSRGAAIPDKNSAKIHCKKPHVKHFGKREEQKHPRKRKGAELSAGWTLSPGSV